MGRRETTTAKRRETPGESARPANGAEFERQLVRVELRLEFALISASCAIGDREPSDNHSVPSAHAAVKDATRRVAVP
jgi:hypothetical protein